MIVVMFRVEPGRNIWRCHSRCSLGYMSYPTTSGHLPQGVRKGAVRGARRVASKGCEAVERRVQGGVQGRRVPQGEYRLQEGVQTRVHEGVMSRQIARRGKSTGARRVARRGARRGARKEGAARCILAARTNSRTSSKDWSCCRPFTVLLYFL